MTISLLPVVKSVYLCDDVVQDAENRKINLLGIFNSLRPRQGPGYPYHLREFCVFAQMVGGIGEAPARVEIVSAQRDEVVYAFPTQHVHFADRHTVVSVCFRIRNCPFPAAGVYFVELFCNNSFVDDRALRLLPVGGHDS